MTPKEKKRIAAIFESGYDEGINIVRTLIFDAKGNSPRMNGRCLGALTGAMIFAKAGHSERVMDEMLVLAFARLREVENLVEADKATEGKKLKPLTDADRKAASDNLDIIKKLL